ncbi:hypothetical protein NDU88_001609 [Pleurodeles waltl]|uniref:Uncharacterized protein n=1 Tax=Pleurodeles waltl TaxID=8319 RepID=A0AAV7VZY5_PLEWA|nr:hypothetical protein NDU88_001609 [Pleurodeles waltl]
MQGRRHSKAPSSRAPVLVASPYLRGWGRRARTHPRSPSHRPPRSRKHKAFHDQPCSNPQAGGGGAPVSPAAVGWLPLKRRAVPRPAACPLTRSVWLPALTRRQAPGRGARRPSPTGSARLALGSTGARVTHTGSRTRSPSICPGGWPRITGEV